MRVEEEARLSDFDSEPLRRGGRAGCGLDFFGGGRNWSRLCWRRGESFKVIVDGLPSLRRVRDWKNVTKRMAGKGVQRLGIPRKDQS